MTITMYGNYKAADGGEVRILCVDAAPPYPVVYIHTSKAGVESVHCCTREGKDRDAHGGPYDIVPEAQEYSVYLNIFRSASGVLVVAEEEDRITADKMAHRVPHERIACIPLKFRQGEGL